MSDVGSAGLRNGWWRWVRCRRADAVGEYLHVEKPFLDQLAALGWTVIDQGQGVVPTDPARSLRDSFRAWNLPPVFRDAVRALNTGADGQPWLDERPHAGLPAPSPPPPTRNPREVND